MVLDNPFQANEKSPNFQKVSIHEANPISASILDRILSFVIDMAIWIPLAKLVLASQKKQILSQLVLESKINTDVLIQISFFGVLYVTLFVFWQGIFVSFFGATPGQLVMGIRVISKETLSRPSFLMSLARGLLLSLGVLTGGWLLLAAFGHSKSKCFHDLATDTVTISNKKSVPNKEFLLYRPFLRTFYLVTVSVMLTVFFATLLTLHEKTKIKLFTFLDQVKPYCEDLPEGEHFYDSALSAFLIGSVDQECLLSFSDEIFHSPNGEFDPKWLYFSKFLTFQDEPELQSQYEKHLCQDTESRECQWVRLYQNRLPGAEVSQFKAQALIEKLLLIKAAQFYFDFDLVYKVSQVLPDHSELNKLKFAIKAGYQAIHSDSKTQHTLIDIIESWDQTAQYFQSLEMICDYELSRSCNHESALACRRLSENAEYLETKDRGILFSRLGRLIHGSICSKSELPRVTNKLKQLSEEDQSYFFSFFNTSKSSADLLAKNLKLFSRYSIRSHMEEQLYVRIYQILRSRLLYEKNLSAHIVEGLLNEDLIENWKHGLQNHPVFNPKLERGIASEAKETL